MEAPCLWIVCCLWIAEMWHASGSGSLLGRSPVLDFESNTTNQLAFLLALLIASIRPNAGELLCLSASASQAYARCTSTLSSIKTYCCSEPPTKAGTDKDFGKACLLKADGAECSSAQPYVSCCSSSSSRPLSCALSAQEVAYTCPSNSSKLFCGDSEVTAFRARADKTGPAAGLHCPELVPQAEGWQCCSGSPTPAPLPAPDPSASGQLACLSATASAAYGTCPTSSSSTFGFCCEEDFHDVPSISKDFAGKCVRRAAGKSCALDKPYAVCCSMSSSGSLACTQQLQSIVYSCPAEYGKLFCGENEAKLYDLKATDPLGPANALHCPQLVAGAAGWQCCSGAAPVPSPLPAPMPIDAGPAACLPTNASRAYFGCRSSSSATKTYCCEDDFQAVSVGTAKSFDGLCTRKAAGRACPAARPFVNCCYAGSSTLTCGMSAQVGIYDCPAPFTSLYCGATDAARFVQSSSSSSSSRSSAAVSATGLTVGAGVTGGSGLHCPDLVPGSENFQCCAASGSQLQSPAGAASAPTSPSGTRSLSPPRLAPPPSKAASPSPVSVPGTAPSGPPAAATPQASAEIEAVAPAGPAPTLAPTASPTSSPTPSPTASPTASPTPAPTSTALPTWSPTPSPTISPTPSPTASPIIPTSSPTPAPTPTTIFVATPTSGLSQSGKLGVGLGVATAFVILIGAILGVIIKLRLLHGLCFRSPRPTNGTVGAAPAGTTAGAAASRV